MITAPTAAPSQTLSGILFLCAGIAIFSVQDLILKLLSGHYLSHPGR